MRRQAKRIIGVLLLFMFISLSIELFSAKKLINDAIVLFTHPFLVLLMIAVYGLSFMLRAYAWYLYIGKQASYKVCLTSLWYSLFINHLSPLKIGDAIRVGYIVSKEKGTKVDEIVHSVIVMRAFDIGVLLLFSSVSFYIFFGTYLQISLSFSVMLMIISALIGIVIVMKFFPEIIKRHFQLLKKAIVGRTGIMILVSILLSWICEAIVIYEVSLILYMPINFLQSIWVNSLTVISGVFQFAPGGIATYETVMAFALSQLKIPWQEAYTMAMISHGFKFLFSYLVGIYAFISFPISVKQIKYWIKTKGVRAK